MTTTPQTPAPPSALLGGGAGLTPDAARALAAKWTRDAADRDADVYEWTAQDDHRQAWINRGRARQLDDCGADLAAALVDASEPNPPTILLIVPGDPVGQGAIRHGKTGVGYHANGRILKPWRERIQVAAVGATGQHAYAAPPKLTKAQKQAGAPRPKPICQICHIKQGEHGLLRGPVRLEVVLTFARPKSDPTRPYPVGRNIGDWDHHGRSVSDALTGVVVADDAQIIDGRTVKTYPGGHPHSLPEPGAVIRVWEIS